MLLQKHTKAIFNIAAAVLILLHFQSIWGEWQKAVRWLCGVCGRGIGKNSIQCTSCQKWVHRKCSGI